MRYSESVPLSEYWKQQQNNQLTSTLKKDTYELIKKAMDEGKPGIKLGGGQNSLSPTIGYSLCRWLKEEHNIQAKYITFNPTGFLTGNQEVYSPYIEIVWDSKQWHTDKFDKFFTNVCNTFTEN
jgi:hypothetical protein